MANGETVPVEESILVVRGRRVLLDGDLAKIYGVETRVLNQAVKRIGRDSPRILRLA